MAKVTSGALRNWIDGEVVTATEYKAEREIIKVAVNDNDDRITVLESAVGGEIHRVPTGTSFPPNPEIGDIFFRSDLDILYVLDINSQWSAQNIKGFNRGQINSTSDINWMPETGSYQVVNIGPLHSSFPSGAEADGNLVIFDGGDSNTQLYFGKTTGIYQRTRIGLDEEFGWTGWRKLATTEQNTVWNMVLESGWVNYQAGMEGRFQIDQMGRVWLNGRFKDGSATDSARLATMPDGHKPTKDHYFKARGCDVLIDTTGAIRLYNVTTPGDIGIDGLSFKAV